MRLIRKPWIWLARIRHRRGYGVHSPFAFAFITGVVNERWPYYAYAALDSLHPWWVRCFRGYPLQCRRLLFRLANFCHPRIMAVVGKCPIEQAYMAQAVPSARWMEVAELCTPRPAADPAAREVGPSLVFIAAEKMALAPQLAGRLSTDSMLVVEGIHQSRESVQLWKSLQADPHTGITFDLYTYGVALFNRTRHKQHYVVCF